MWIVPLDAGQVRHSVVSTHHKYKSKHHTYSEVDPLICHGGYHFPGILASVIPLHAVYSRRSTVIKTQRLKSSNSPKSDPLLAIPSFASTCSFVCLHFQTFMAISTTTSLYRPKGELTLHIWCKNASSISCSLLLKPEWQFREPLFSFEWELLLSQTEALLHCIYFFPPPLL